MRMAALAYRRKDHRPIVMELSNSIIPRIADGEASSFLIIAHDQALVTSEDGRLTSRLARRPETALMSRSIIARRKSESSGNGGCLASRISNFTRPQLDGIGWHQQRSADVSRLKFHPVVLWSDRRLVSDGRSSAAR